MCFNSWKSPPARNVHSFKSLVDLLFVLWQFQNLIALLFHVSGKFRNWIHWPVKVFCILPHEADVIFEFLNVRVILSLCLLRQCLQTNRSLDPLIVPQRQLLINWIPKDVWRVEGVEVFDRLLDYLAKNCLPTLLRSSWSRIHHFLILL